MDFSDLLQLEPVDGSGTAWTAVGPDYPWGGLYGGQVAAQALRAAAATVEHGRAAQSLHVSFLRRGHAGEAVRYDVEALRDGRGLTTRLVRARQGTTELATAVAAFQAPEASPEVIATEPPRAVSAPQDSPADTWTPMFDRRFAEARLAHPGRARGWFRMTEPLGPDPVAHACALVFCSDDLPTDAVISLHPDRPPHLEAGTDPARAFSGASLDHAVWFHRPAPADEWLLHDLRSEVFSSARGLCTGRIWAPDGTLVASVAQEVLLRPPRASRVRP